MNFTYKSALGGGFHGVIGSPLFAPPSFSSGLQLVDLFAYVINQHHSGRIQMKEYFSEVESMQFVSSIKQDEFDIKGMNLIE